MEYEYDGIEDYGGRVLWGRVVFFVTALLLVFFGGRCTASGGVSQDEVSKLKDQVAQLSDQNTHLNDQLAAAQASTGNPLGQSTEAPSEAAVAPAADRGDAQPADSASQGGNGADSGETGSRSSREPQAPVGTTYRVQEGDTLQSIAQKFYGDERKYTLITKANHISASKVLVPGQKLIITSDPEQQ